MESTRHASHLNAVADALRRITQAIRLSSSIVQDKLGITGAQLYVLQQLADQPGASLRELADRTLTDQSSVSVVVGRIVEAGYATRRTSPADRRRTELTLTAAGRQVLRRSPELAQTRLMVALRDLPASQLRVTAWVLERVARAVGPTNRPAPMFFEPTTRARGVAPRRRNQAPRTGRGSST
jgi:DNA-binding MarR family transcriptional regulator